MQKLSNPTCTIALVQQAKKHFKAKHVVHLATYAAAAAYGVSTGSKAPSVNVAQAGVLVYALAIPAKVTAAMAKAPAPYGPKSGVVKAMVAHVNAAHGWCKGSTGQAKLAAQLANAYPFNTTATVASATAAGNAAKPKSGGNNWAIKKGVFAVVQNTAPLSA